MSTVVQRGTELSKGLMRLKHIGKHTNLYFHFISTLLGAKSMQSEFYTFSARRTGVMVT